MYVMCKSDLGHYYNTHCKDLLENKLLKAWVRGVAASYELSKNPEVLNRVRLVDLQPVHCYDSLSKEILVGFHYSYKIYLAFSWTRFLQVLT